MSVTQRPLVPVCDATNATTGPLIGGFVGSEGALASPPHASRPVTASMAHAERSAVLERTSNMDVRSGGMTAGSLQEAVLDLPSSAAITAAESAPDSHALRSRIRNC